MLWLRWTLSVRLWRRASVAGSVVAVVTAIAAGVTAVAGFGFAFGLGMLLLPRAGPQEVLIAGDGVVGGFLFFWAIGVMTELQRTEPLSLSKLLHLPVSLDSAFLLNYAASWLCLSQFF